MARNTNKPSHLTPLVKWAGGKHKLAPYLYDKIDFEYNTYYEPFMGGAALLLYLTPKYAVCSDVNKELVNFYNVVKKCPHKLIEELKNHFAPYHSKEFYYEVRAWDRDEVNFSQMDDVKRAARFIYLNKNCYNGLWRENTKGQNNVPVGRYPNLNLPKEDDILRIGRYLNHKGVSIKCCDYKEGLEGVAKGDLVYLDPPYDIEEKENGFVNYSQNGFTRKDQQELRDVCNDLVSRGAVVMVNNSNTDFIRELYSDTSIYTLYDDQKVTRFVGSHLSSRFQVTELLIIGKQQ